MTRRLTLGVLLAAWIGLLHSASPAQHLFWTSAQLATLDKKLHTTLDADKGSHEELMPSTNSYFVMVHKEASAPTAEIHQKHGDFAVVRTGQGAVLTGGKFLGNRPTAPNEMRGRIEGGVKHLLAAGDAFYIPANLPHQMVVEPGKRFTVEILKIEQKDGARDLTEFKFWSAADLVASQTKLKSKMDQYKNAVDILARTDSYEIMMNHKEGTALSEIHMHLAEFQIIRNGEGAMMLGGNVVNSRTTGTDEVRGTALDGAFRQPLAAGDVLYIPPNTPHHTIVESGKSQDKLIVKVWVP